jgi:hypothetical protein
MVEERRAMLFGMSPGEVGLVVFIFGLVYFAQLVPRLGAFVGEKLGGR